MIRLNTPIGASEVRKLKAGDQVEIYGKILCGRDAVLPKLAAMIREGHLKKLPVDLAGSVIFHTAVSPAGIGPTTSNKVEIEESIPELAKAGVRVHLGKGSLGRETIRALDQYESVFAVTPPVSALFSDRTLEMKVVAFHEEGMEALFEILVEGLPAIIAAANGTNVFDPKK
jgi:fumarate hydratase subunit beta